MLRYNGIEKELYGGELNTTNNRMELMAAIMGLEALKKPCRVLLCTDSQYLMKGITEWISSWKARGWKTASRTPVKNVDLWERLNAAMGQHQIQWEWVRGHTGHPENERADRLANLGIDSLCAQRDEKHEESPVRRARRS